MIDGVSYVFVYEDELKEMMERVDVASYPKVPTPWVFPTVPALRSAT